MSAAPQPNPGVVLAFVLLVAFAGAIGAVLFLALH
jgi:hypothetical protein